MWTLHIQTSAVWINDVACEKLSFKTDTRGHSRCRHEWKNCVIRQMLECQVKSKTKYCINIKSHPFYLNKRDTVQILIISNIRYFSNSNIFSGIHLCSYRLAVLFSNIFFLLHLTVLIFYTVGVHWFHCSLAVTSKFLVFYLFYLNIIITCVIKQCRSKHVPRTTITGKN